MKRSSDMWSNTLPLDHGGAILLFAGWTKSVLCYIISPFLSFVCGKCRTLIHIWWRQLTRVLYNTSCLQLHWLAVHFRSQNKILFHLFKVLSVTASHIYAIWSKSIHQWHSCDLLHFCRWQNVGFIIGFFISKTRV